MDWNKFVDVPSAMSEGGMSKVYGLVRAFKRGSLVRHGYPRFFTLLEKAVGQIAFDAWEQGKKAHPDCENPFKGKT